MNYKETKEQFLIALNSNAYINMCTTDDMLNAIVALDKQIPMEHHHTKVFEIHNKERISLCPNCLGMIITRAEKFPKFCTWCGQAIDWEKEYE